MTCISIIGATIASILGSLVFYFAGFVQGYDRGLNETDKDKLEQKSTIKPQKSSKK